MTLERYLRLIAGAFVLISLAMGYWVSPSWFLFTAFVELVPIGFYELVSYDDISSTSRRESIVCEDRHTWNGSGPSFGRASAR